MNKTLIFLCLSSSILVLSIIVICVSPIINNFVVTQNNNWSFSSWRSLNCKIYADLEESDTVTLDAIQQMKIYKNLCRRKKGMHDLEYTTLIIDLFIGIVCTNLSLLIYFKIGKDLAKKAGLISIIIGIIGFIMTFVYIGFSGYIFENDPAKFDDDNVEKLYPNGANKKLVDGVYKTIYQDDKSYFSKYAKFKELGQKQYNYDKKFYYAFHHNDMCDGTCEYLYNRAYTSYEYKDLHDRWLTALVFSVFILVLNASLVVFGFLIFKNGTDSNEDKTLVIS